MSGASSLPLLLQPKAKGTPGGKSIHRKSKQENQKEQKKKKKKQKTTTTTTTTTSRTSTTATTTATTSTLTTTKKNKDDESSVPKNQSPGTSAKRHRDDSEKSKDWDGKEDTNNESPLGQDVGVSRLSSKRLKRDEEEKIIDTKLQLPGERASRKRRDMMLPLQMKDNRDVSCVVSSPLGAVQTPVLSTRSKDLLLERLTLEILSKFDYSLSPPPASPRDHRNKPQKRRRRRDAPSTRPDSAHHPQPQKPNGQGATGENAVEDGHVGGGGETSISDGQLETQNLTLFFRRVVQSRLVCGVNQCTRFLERSLAKASASATAPIDTAATGTTSTLSEPEPEAAARESRTPPRMIWLARDVRPPHIMAHIPTMAKLLGTNDNDSVPLVLLPGQASVDLGKCLGAKLVAVVAFLPACRETDAALLADLTDDETRREEGKAMMVRFHKAMDAFIEYCLCIARKDKEVEKTTEEQDE